MRGKDKAVNQKPRREAATHKQAGGLPQAEKDTLQAITNAIEYGLTIIDKDYGILYQSQPSKTTGRYHLGEKCYRAFEGRDEVCDGCPVVKAFKDGEPHTAERKVATPSGDVVFLENTASPIRDAEGKITSCLEIGRDVTARKQAEAALRESEERYRTVIEGAHDMIQSIAPDGHIVFVNQAWLDTLGYTNAELPSLNLFQVIHPDSRAHCQGMFAKVMSGEAVYGIQASFLTKDGRRVLVEGNAAPRIIGGKVVATQGIFRNVTARKQAEVALQVEKNKLQSLVDAMEYGLTIQDRDYNIIYQNETLRAIFGDRVGEKCYRAYESRDEMCERCPVEKAFRDGKSHNSERRVILPSGEVTFWENTANPVRDAEGKITSCLELTRNITERKKAEEALRQSQEKLRQMFESVTDGILVVDLNGAITEANQSAVAMHGFSSRDELLGKSALELVAPRDRERVATNMQEALRRGAVRSVEYILLRADGADFPGELSTSVLRDASGKWVGHITIVRDVSERKKAEETLQAEKNKLQSLIDAMEYGINILDKDYNIVYQNERFQRTSGNQVGEKCYQAYGGQDRVCDNCPVEKTFKDGKSHSEERKVVTPSGEVTFWEHSASPIRDAEGKVASCLELTHDVTERKRMEQALRESEERFRSIVESSHAGIMILDDAYHFTYANDELCRMSGYSREEIIGQDFRQFLDEESRQLVADRYIRRQRGEELPPRYEFNFIHKERQKRRVEIISSVIRDSAGKVKTVAQLLDITARKQAEEELILRAQILDGATDEILLHDFDGNLIYVNEAVCRMHGYSREELLKMKVSQIVAPERVGDLDSDFKKMLEKGEAVFESVHLRKDGSIVPTEVHGRTIESGGRKLLLTVARDITERKKADEELRLRAQILDGATDAIFVHDLDDNFIYVNEAACRTHGYTREEFMKMKLPQIVEPGRARGLPPDREELLGKGHLVTESVHLRKDGSIMPVEIHARTIEMGGDKLFLTLARDITERKRVEEELRLRARMLDSATDAILVHDLDENIVYVNEATCRTHGYRREELLRMKIPQIIVPGKVSGLPALRQETLGKGGAIFETTHLRKDGSTMPMDVHSRTIEVGGETLVLAVMRDITERKKAEEALKRQQAYFQQLFDNSPDAVAWVDIADRFVSVNKGFETLFGYKAEEVKGRIALDLIVPEGRREEMLALSRTIFAGKPARTETVRKRKDGSLVNIAILGYPIWFEGKVVGRYILYTDITARIKAEEAERRMQQELYLSRRLAAIGELAAGVAHEINNPLTGVIGFSQRLLRKSANEQASRDLEIIRDEAQRAANIVQNLLTFARRRSPKKEYSDINDIVQKALELRSYELQGGNIEVVTDLAPSLPKLLVDFPQIQEVFLNIILNAENAMNEAHGRGRLIIKTRQIKDYVRISFADNGPGIPPEKLDKVFDPFFTTREEKGGTGLGLSICHGIVTGHGGRIYARSKAGGGGTTFFVELPLTPAEATVRR